MVFILAELVAGDDVITAFSARNQQSVLSVAAEIRTFNPHGGAPVNDNAMGSVTLKLGTADEPIRGAVDPQAGIAVEPGLQVNEFGAAGTIDVIGTVGSVVAIDHALCGEIMDLNASEINPGSINQHAGDGSGLDVLLPIQSQVMERCLRARKNHQRCSLVVGSRLKHRSCAIRTLRAGDGGSIVNQDWTGRNKGYVVKQDLYSFSWSAHVKPLAV